MADHYWPDAEWGQQPRPHVGPVFVIDDLANRDHDALLDQNYNPNAEARYGERLPAGAVLAPTVNAPIGGAEEIWDISSRR